VAEHPLSAEQVKHEHFSSADMPLPRRQPKYPHLLADAAVKKLRATRSEVASISMLSRTTALP
jgi:hypothetical protein